ncbi:hypothetical protein CFC21_054177 [Triticum aestivum]|uniref:Uncharacterized protein n=2 Tax=Triticum aestivum TaxID=4565 RepID=A0A9R1GDF5_WHEAT|nr:uncharacterized protein LOC123082681 [Triticum aestivum]KAF7045029.1 hypothetical protein CFC21_054177 [Triticum aestivum]
MCRGTVDGLRPLGARRRLEVRAFYLRLSSSSTSAPPAELTLVYRPAIGGAALELAGRALPPACPAEVTLLRVRGNDGKDDAPAYANADRVSATEGARFEVYAAGKEELAAEGAFAWRNGGWRVECRRPVASRSPVAEVLVLAVGGVLVRARARASPARRIGCATRLEGIPEEEDAPCECGACGDEWEMVGAIVDEFKEHEEEAEEETMRWALEMGAWAVCVGVGLLATARRFRRRRPALR